MNQSTRKNIIFFVGVFMAVASASVELWLFVALVNEGTFEALKLTVAAANGLLVFGSIKMILKSWSSMFIEESNPVALGSLSNCYSRRFQVVSQTDLNSRHIIPALNRQLITQYLVLLEGLLQTNLGRHHYELSLFCGSEAPEIIAYFDSNGNMTPRSHSKRAENPQYYIENNYEVVEILKDPSTETQFIENTLADSEDYSFTSEEQKGKVRSTLLHCIDVRIPAAIVITCNKEKILGPGGDFKEAFLSVYFGIATDLYLGLLMGAAEQK